MGRMIRGVTTALLEQARTERRVGARDVVETEVVIRDRAEFPRTMEIQQVLETTVARDSIVLGHRPSVAVVVERELREQTPTQREAMQAPEVALVRQRI